MAAETDSASASSLAARVTDVLQRQAAKPLAPGLYLVATPIGNLADITLRALAVLAAADAIFCEDTRHSRTLLAHYGLGGRLQSYHEHNAAAERPRLMAALAAGQRVALISDAGTPLISDPGYKLVRAALDAGHAVTAIPGASAPIAALIGSGLPTDTFLFAGFLPTKDGQRRARLAELAAIPATLVLFEAPQRLAESLAAMATVLGTREVAVARELTKLHEATRRGSAAELAAWAQANPPKGEIVLVVAPPGAHEVSDTVITERLAEALGHMSLRDAARGVAEALGVPKARVYDIGLGLKGGRS